MKKRAIKMKLPSVPGPNMSELTKKQLKGEDEKSLADAAAGRMTPAAEAVPGLREKDTH